MIIPDPLYRRIQLPDWLIPIIKSPELQRLRDIRLINTSSVSCPSLSDVKRFTHTLGVFYLANQLERRLIQRYSKPKFRTFLIATLLHDIGTPPFGHLFEYQLTALTGWNHEEMVREICLGNYRLENRYHQIYFSNSLVLFNVLKEISVDPQEVVDIILGKGDLGTYLSGSIDIDNIDNVFRMGTMLGLEPNISDVLKCFNGLKVDDGFIYNNESLSIIKEWQMIRKKSYEILAFDEWCLSGQAMLTDCFSISLRKGLLKEDHWFFTDEELLRQLIKFKETKNIAQRFAIGDYYKLLYIGWYNLPKGESDLRHPETRERLRKDLENKIKMPCSPYVFYDRGAFSKEILINYNDQDETSQMKLGESSESTIISIFTHRRVEATKIIKNTIAEVLEDWGYPISKLKPIPRKEETYGQPIQRKIQY